MKVILTLVQDLKHSLVSTKEMDLHDAQNNMTFMLLETSVSITNGTGKNDFHDRFNLSSLGWINGNSDIANNVTHKDYNTLSKNNAHKLLSYLIILRIINACATIPLNDLINDNSINDSNSDVYNDLRIYVNSVLNIKLIIQIWYDILELNTNNFHYKSDNALPNSLIILQVSKITDGQVNLIVDYVINDKGKIYDADDVSSTTLIFVLKQVVKFVFETFKNIVNIHIHNNEYTSLYTKNQRLIIDTNIRLIQLLVAGTTSSEWYVLQISSYNLIKICV